MNILRPLSPHLPIYKPHLTSTFLISHRISGAFLATIVFFFLSSLSENWFDLLHLLEFLPILLLFIKAHPNLRRDYRLSPVLSSV